VFEEMIHVCPLSSFPLSLTFLLKP
jgi:hypothetical protein